MTCIEKLREIHPEWTEAQVTDYVKRGCPTRLYIMHKPIYCGWETSESQYCKMCWDRNVTAESQNIYNAEFCLTGEDMRRVRQLAKRVDKTTDEVLYAALNLYEYYLDALTLMLEKCPEEARSLEVKAYLNRVKRGVDVTEVVLK